MKRRIIASLMTVTMAATLFAGCGGGSDSMANMSAEERAAWEAAAADPYGKYPELVTYTCGYVTTNQGGDTLAGTPYENDSPSDNAYTRYVRDYQRAK